MQIEIRVPGATCSYYVPVMKVQNYAIETIFEKKLFFLIPFHLFAYEQNFKVYEENPQKLNELTAVYDEIAEKLNVCEESGIIDAYTKVMVVDMSKKVLEHLAMKYSNVKKEVGAIMGGKILDYPAKQLRRQGQQDKLIEQVQKKLAKGQSVEQIAEDLVEELSVIQEIVKELNK